VFDWKAKKSETVIGYAASFSLLNGFEKVTYTTVADLKVHGMKFSQTFKKGFGLWKDDFDSMAIKTVLKLLLARYAPLSVEMQKAVITDQGFIKDADTLEVTYDDNEQSDIDKEAERVALMISDAKTLEELKAVEPHLKEGQLDLYTMKQDQLKAKK